MPYAEEPPRPTGHGKGTGAPGIPASPFDESVADYDAWYDEAGRLVFETELRALRKVLPSLPGPWLEVGVGTGRFAQALGIGTGVDIAVKMIEVASQRDTAVLLARGEQLPFGDRCFGAVFLITTMCFIKQPLSILREVHRVLVPDGKLVLAVMPSHSTWTQLYEEMKPQGHPLYTHAIFRSHDELINLIERGDFSVQNTFSTLLQGPDKVTHAESPQTGFRIGAGFVVIVAGKHSGQD